MYCIIVVIVGNNFFCFLLNDNNQQKEFPQKKLNQNTNNKNRFYVFKCLCINILTHIHKYILWCFAKNL